MGHVSVAHDTISAQGGGRQRITETFVEWGGDATFVVDAESLDHPQVLDAVATAVMAAGERFSRVDWDTGRELSEEEINVPHAAYTPNFVSSPTVSDLGVAVWADTKGELNQPMLDGMLTILVEELTKLDVDTRVSCPPLEFQPPLWPHWVPSTQ